MPVRLSARSGQLNLQLLAGVGVDGPTWLWLRRKYPELVAARLKLGYRIVGLHAFEPVEIDAGADLWEATGEQASGAAVKVY